MDNSKLFEEYFDTTEIPSPQLVAATKNLWAVMRSFTDAYNKLHLEYLKLKEGTPEINNFKIEFETENQALKDRVNYLEGKADEFESDIHIKENEIGLLNQIILELKNEIKTHEMELTGLRDDINLKDVHIEHLNTEISTHLEKIDKLTNQIENYEEIENINNDLKAAFGNSQLEIAKLNKLLSENEIKLSEFGLIKGDLENLVKENSVLKNQLTELQNLIDEYKITISESEEKIKLTNQLEQDLKVKNDEIENLNKRLNDLVSTNEKLNLEISALNESLNSLKENFDNQSQKVIELKQFENEHYTTHKENSQLKLKISELTELNSKLNEDKLNSDNKVFSLLKDKTQLTAQIELLKNSIQEYERKLLEKDNHTAGLENLMNEYRNKEELEAQRKSNLINDLGQQIEKLGKALNISNS